MKKIFITGFALLSLLKLSAQTPSYSTDYKPKKLKIEEINLISSYYNQNGNNAAVTGGIGSEKLTDISNVIDVQLIRYDKKGQKHIINGDVGIDYYTSASSDQIDLKANSSASSADIRLYPSVNYGLENDEKGTTKSAGLSSSTEYDYQSFGGHVGYAKKTKDKSGEFSIKANLFLDQVKLILPIELRDLPNTSAKSSGTEARNTFALSASFSKIINDHLQIMFVADVIKQQGYLSLPFHRVYFDDGSVNQENLPGNRLKIPLAIRASYFLGDNIILRGYYRFYTDDWGLNSHTMNLEVPIKFNPTFSLSPFYRYYTQSAIRYFDGFKKHTAQDEFVTSNYDVSKFNSNFFGCGMKYTPISGVLGMKNFHTIEFRYGHYNRSNGLYSGIFSLNIKYK